MGYIDDKIKDFLQKSGGRFNDHMMRSINGLDYREALAGIEQIGKDLDSNFVLDRDNMFVYENLAKWLIGDSSFMCQSLSGDQVRGNLFSGIYLGGKTGTGKSTAMYVLMRLSKIIRASYSYADRKIPLYSRGILATDICDQYAISGSLREYKDEDVLLINDLGAEAKETLYMGNRLPVLRNLLECRGDLPGKFTLITSNIPMGGDPMIQRYGERVTSRLVRMCNFFYLGGRDRRTR